jgi:hypothetical protein
MTKTQAINKARSEVRLYSQGHGWIITQYDYKADAWRVSQEMPFAKGARFSSPRMERTSLSVDGLV